LNALLERRLVVAYDEKGRKYFKIAKRGKRILHAIDELKVLA